MILPVLSGEPDEQVLWVPDMIGIDGLLGNVANGTWPSANLGIFIPFTIQQTRIAYSLFYAAGTTSSGNLDMGIYDEAGNRLVSNGAVAEGAISTNVTLNIADTTLTPGRYYLGMACDGTAGGYSRWAPNANFPDLMQCKQMASAYSAGLVATATFATYTQSYLPNIGIALRSENAV